MCKKWIWLTVWSVAGPLAVNLPCGQAGEPNAPACVQATAPSPADGAVDVLRDGTVLKWTGSGADEYDVYLGTSSAAVAQADQAATGLTAVRIGQKTATLDPGRLELGRTYFWRVDQVKVGKDDPNAVQICPGAVWSFSVEPVALAVTNIKATTSCSIYDNMGPEKTIDGSGLVGDLHSASMEDMWLSCAPAAVFQDPNDPNGPLMTPEVWIQYEFDNEYKLSEMWVWNWNSAADKYFGLGAKEVTILYSGNGTDWTPLGEAQFARAPGQVNYAPNTIVNLNVVAKYVKIVMKSSYRGLNEYGLSEVRFYSIPVRATQPSPAPGTKGVPLNPVLSWRAGREAASHKVYLGTDKQAVSKGTAKVYTLTTNTLALPAFALDLGKTYYWKVAEVNEGQNPAVFDSGIWDFRTVEYLVVDDFESYTSSVGSGWKDALHASLALEKSVVHGGKQSLTISYDNTAVVPTWIQVTCVNKVHKNWSSGAARKLVLFMRGDAEVPTRPRVNLLNLSYDGPGQGPWWGCWTIDLGTSYNDTGTFLLTFVIPPSSKGKVYIDDVRLYPSVPLPSIVDQVVKLNGSGATKGQFDTLAALALADAALLGTLSGDQAYTLMAPTDAAFTAAGINEKTDKAVLADILRYHVSPGVVGIDNVGQVQTLEGSFLVQDANVVTDDIGGQAVIAGSTDAANGRILTVNAVLMPFQNVKLIDLLKSMNKAGDFAGQFDTLLAGITAAKPAVRDTLGKRHCTLFAPTDEAFAVFGIDPNTVGLLQPSALSDLLLYHVVSGRLMGDAVLAAGEIKTAQGAVLTQQEGTLTDLAGGTVKIIGMDAEASNGVIHVVDGVAVPYLTVTQLFDIASVITSLNAGGDLAGQFGLLIAAVEAADPSVLVAVATQGPYTIFAPTNSAFTALGWDAAKIGSLDKTYLTDVLKYHIVSGALKKSAIQTAGQLKTLQGGALAADPNTAELTDLLGGKAKITIPNIVASNGVIQVVDAVLLPAAEPKPAVVEPNTPAPVKP
jgi:uncharacterized surface protein with fasciclin (FAS1) repeats